MSDTPSTTTPAAEPPDLSEIRLSILTRLALAIDAAAQRLQNAAAGQSVFASDADLKAALALLKLLPDILALLPKPKPRYEPRPYQPPKIYCPECPHCGAGPNTHWPENCPQCPR